jgi:hypothetical protein
MLPVLASGLVFPCLQLLFLLLFPPSWPVMLEVMDLRINNLAINVFFGISSDFIE